MSKSTQRIILYAVLAAAAVYAFRAYKAKRETA